MSDRTSKDQQIRSVLPGPGRFGGGFGRGRGPVVKPKNLTGTLKRLWHYIEKERKWLMVVFLFILASMGLTLLGPYLIGVSIDAMGPGDSVHPGLLQMIVIVLAIAYLADGLFNLLQGWLMAGLSQRIVKQLRAALFVKLQKLPVAYFDARPNGEVMSRLSNDIDNVSSTISQSTAQLMSGALTLIGSLVMMMVLSAPLTIATLATVPLVFLLTRTITSKTRAMFKDQQVQLGRLNGHIEETISGIQVVKAFNHETKAITEFDAINAELRKVGYKAQVWSGLLMPLMNVINNIGFALVAIVGGFLAMKDLVTVGVIASFLSYSRQFVRPLNDLANIYNMLQSGIAGAERVFEVLDEQEEPEDIPGAVELKDPKGRIVFENVSFGYRKDVPILQNISFEAVEGSSTALVGPTGAGKTTIVNLLTRFYDVTGGRILLDGRDLREYSRDSLRKCFGFVLQDTYLFSGTIKENIRYGKPDATDEEVKEAASLANADGFIQRLSDKYDTMLSENGGNLSQGQRQLLAIARVILAKPSILILDEATSSIDTRTELHIQDALLTLMKGRTSFIIAHRLNTIRHANSILVIDRGEIAEQGSHKALMERKGIYYSMSRNLMSEDMM